MVAKSSDVMGWLANDEFNNVADLVQTVCAYFIRRETLQNQLSATFYDEMEFTVDNYASTGLLKGREALQVFQTLSPYAS